MNSLSITDSAEKATSLSNVSIPLELVEQEESIVPRTKENSEVSFDVDGESISSMNAFVGV
jgi:hypothetical protein